MPYRMRDTLLRYGLQRIFYSDYMDPQDMPFRQTPLEDIIQVIHLVVNEFGTTILTPEEEEKRFFEIKEEEPLPICNPILFKVNKPFVFLIYDETIKIILYITIINDPREYMQEYMQ